MMIVKERELEKDRTIKDEKYMHEVVQAEEKLGLGNDTYAMAFKAFNWKVIDELDMDQKEVHNAYQAAMFVFGIQMLMLIFVGSVVLQDTFIISTP